MGASAVRTLKRDTLTIVFPPSGNFSYRDLARRIAVACEEIAQPVELCAAHKVNLLAEESLKDRVYVLVMPSECLGSIDNTGTFLSRVASAKKRILLIGEPVEDEACEAQLDLPIAYDALVDVGFVSQEAKAADLPVPYHFLFNGPTRSERQTLQGVASDEKRGIPWTLVGTMVPKRVSLVAELVERVDPGGFVFMPKSRMPRRKTLLATDHWRISPFELSKVLRRTRYYVWCSRHEFKHFESFRFVDALLAGAVPCKIDEKGSWKDTRIPGVFPSVEGFKDCIDDEGFDRMSADAREFYLNCGLLSDSLEKVLRSAP
jgi:hypothetical protein